MMIPNQPLPSLQLQVKMKPAGFWLRFLAMWIDSMILQILMTPLWIVYYVVYFLAIGLHGERAGSLSAMVPVFIMLGIIYPLFFLGAFFYHAWFYKNKGATPGKMIFRMQVVDSSTGKNLSYGKTFLREFVGKFVCFITFLIGYIIAGFRQDKRGLHDMIANTQVLRQIG